MAEMVKKLNWADCLSSSEENLNEMDEPGVSSAEHEEVEKPDTPVPGDTSEPGTSSGTGEHEKVKDSGALYKPRTSPRTRDHIEIQSIPVVNDDTGRMYKVYEVLMERFGIKIPELRYENLSGFEKDLRERKSRSVIFFEEVTGEEEEKIALARTPKEVLGLAYQVCRKMTRTRIPVKAAKMVTSPMPGTVMIKVKFHLLEFKKVIMENKKNLIGTKYSVDHDLTKTEIHVQSQLLKLWRKKGYRKNFMLTKKTRIHVGNKWITLHPVSSQTTGESTK